MNTLKIVTAIAAVLAAFTSFNVFAADTINVYVDRDTRAIHIYGKIDGEFAGNVNLIVEHAEGEAEPYDHIEQKYFKSGEYSFAYKSEAENDIYTARINYSNNTGVLEKNFNIYSADLNEKLRQAVNTAVDADGVADIIMNNENFIFDSDASYLNITKEGKSVAAAEVFKNIPFSGVQPIIDTVYTMYAAQMMFEASSAEAKYDILKNNFSFFALTELDEYSLLLSKDEIFRKRVAEIMVINRITSVESIADIFRGGVLLAQLEKTINISEVRSYLLNSHFQLTKYREIADTRSIDECLKGCPFNTIDDLEDKIEALIAKNQGSKPSGERGGGGSSGSISIKSNLSAVTPYKEEASIQFTDVDKTYWGYESIKALQIRGVLSGDGDGNFRPSNTVSREEFLKILLESLKLVDDTAQCTFLDVSVDNWSYVYIATAQKHGIVSGRDENIFDIKAYITREEAFHIIYKTLIFKGCSLKNEQDYTSFDDESGISDYALEGIKALYKTGIINGVGDNLLAPKNCITRAEAAKTVYAVLQKVI